MSEAMRKNYENYFPKQEVKTAPALPRKGKLVKESIGSPANFRHIYGFSKWE